MKSFWSAGRILLGSAAASVLLAPGSLLACAACYGQSDAPMAEGMNWGILSLLGVILTVLGGIAAFFISLARNAAKRSAPVPTGQVPVAEGELRAEPDPVS